MQALPDAHSESERQPTEKQNFRVLENSVKG